MAISNRGRNRNNIMQHFRLNFCHWGSVRRFTFIMQLHLPSPPPWQLPDTGKLSKLSGHNFHQLRFPIYSSTPQSALAQYNSGKVHFFQFIFLGKFPRFPVEFSSAPVFHIFCGCHLNPHKHFMLTSCKIWKENIWLVWNEWIDYFIIVLFQEIYRTKPNFFP